MFCVSIIYLVGAIILIIFKKIHFDPLDLFNTDGLALLGCFFAIGELILSKRNFISKKINEAFICGKYINYRIDISARSINKTINIEEISNKLEKIFNTNLNLSNLDRKPQSKLLPNRWCLKYENLGLEVEYVEESYDLYIIFKGKAQYGKINTRDKDILYLTSLVKMLSNEFLQDKTVRRQLEINKIELIIRKDGSQIKLRNVFNEDIGEVHDYTLKVIKNLNEKSEMIISKNQIKLSALTEGTFFEGFMELTNIICNIN